MNGLQRRFGEVLRRYAGSGTADRGELDRGVGIEAGHVHETGDGERHLQRAWTVHSNPSMSLNGAGFE